MPQSDFHSHYDLKLCVLGASNLKDALTKFETIQTAQPICNDSKVNKAIRGNLEVKNKSYNIYSSSDLIEQRLNELFWNLKVKPNLEFIVTAKKRH